MFFYRNSNLYLVDGSGYDCSPLLSLALCTSAKAIFLMLRIMYSEIFYCFGCRLINLLHCFLFCLMDVKGTMSIFYKRLTMCEHIDLWKYISATYRRKKIMVNHNYEILSNNDVIIMRLKDKIMRYKSWLWGEKVSYDIKCWNNSIKNNSDKKC